MQAHDLMTEDVASLPEDASIDDVISLMTELEVRHVPLVADDGRLIGVLSDRDMRMVDGLIAQSIHNTDDNAASAAELLASPARSLLSGLPITCAFDTPVDDVINLLVGKRVGAVVVVDEQAKVTGIISAIDVLAAARGKLGA